MKMEHGDYDMITCAILPQVARVYIYMYILQVGIIRIIKSFA